MSLLREELHGHVALLDGFNESITEIPILNLDGSSFLRLPRVSRLLNVNVIAYKVSESRQRNKGNFNWRQLTPEILAPPESQLRLETNKLNQEMSQFLTFLSEASIPERKTICAIAMATTRLRRIWICSCFKFLNARKKNVETLDTMNLNLSHFLCVDENYSTELSCGALFILCKTRNGVCFWSFSWKSFVVPLYEFEDLRNTMAF